MYLFILLLFYFNFLSSVLPLKIAQHHIKSFILKVASITVHIIENEKEPL